MTVTTSDTFSDVNANHTIEVTLKQESQDPDVTAPDITTQTGNETNNQPKQQNTVTTTTKPKEPYKTIKSLKEKKKYYVRVRTYKTVKVNGKSKKG